MSEQKTLRSLVRTSLSSVYFKVKIFSDEIPMRMRQKQQAITHTRNIIIIAKLE
jgi:hypothetical protein